MGIPNQIELRKCLLENPDLPVEFIRELLIAKDQDRLSTPFKFEEGNEQTTHRTTIRSRTE